MLHLYLGTDRDKARAEMARAIAKAGAGADIVRITDAHSLDDLRTALQGGGMFGGKRVLVFEGVAAHPELVEVFLDSLEFLAHSDEVVFVFEEKPLAELRKKLEKHAQKVEKFDAPKKAPDTSIFKMADALRAHDKKALWVCYMQELAKGKAPEAILGVLFWSAKELFLKSEGNTPVHSRAGALVASLSELPHEARRRGEDLEYALERFVLSGA